MPALGLYTAIPTGVNLGRVGGGKRKTEQAYHVYKTEPEYKPLIL